MWLQFQQIDLKIEKLVRQMFIMSEFQLLAVFFPPIKIANLHWICSFAFSMHSRIIYIVSSFQSYRSSNLDCFSYCTFGLSFSSISFFITFVGIRSSSRYLHSSCLTKLVKICYICFYSYQTYI